MSQWNAHQKAAILTIALLDAPKGLTARQAAELLSISNQAARNILDNLSGYPGIPLWIDEAGRWRKLRDSDYLEYEDR